LTSPSAFNASSSLTPYLNYSQSSTSSTVASGDAQNATYTIPVGNISSATLLTLNSTITTTGYWNRTATTTSARSTISYLSGSAAIWSCVSEWAVWIQASSDLQNSELGWHAVEFTTTYTTTVSEYSLYTLCDGIPRAVASGSPIISTLFSVYSIPDGSTFLPETEIIEEIVIPPRPIPTRIYETMITTVTWTLRDNPSIWTGNTTLPPSPTCMIAPSDCAWLSAESSNAIFTGGAINSTAVPALYCERSNPVFTSGPCSIYIPAVQLL
jgi:hypothetical protein